MLIREFIEADRPSLRKVYLETRRQTFSRLRGDSFQLDDFDKDTAGEKVWICELSKEVIGFVSVWEPDNFFHHLFILPEITRQGYGSQLLTVCMTHMSHPVKLKCVSRNTDALEFYHSKGWRTILKGMSSDGEYQLMQADET